MAGSHDTWLISGEERSKHDIQFFQLKPVNGFVTGTQARDFFMLSGLPTQVLGQIWTLADINGDGKMDRKEFSIAMHLIKKKLQGYELPKVLPASLKTDPSPMIGSFAQPTIGGIPMSQPVGMSFPIGGTQMGMPVGSMIQPQASLGTATMTTGSLGLGPLMYNGAAGSFSHESLVSAPLTSAGALAAVPGRSALQSGGSVWAMHQAAKLKHTQTFNINDRNNRGYLLGVEARTILMQSGLPQPVLAQIWTLSDIDRDGKLTCDEFCIAMHLSELARMGQVLPATLPQELFPVKTGAGNAVSQLSASAAHGPQKDVFGDLLSSVGMPLPVPTVSASQPVEEEEQVTFEDKRKENFDKGQAELERRRAVLREQQQREENERLEKERQEAEKRERQRQEVENRRQAEFQRQIEKQREREREIEEQRRKMGEQREAARRELERQQQLEWEKQRKEQLVIEKERESEQLRMIKAQMANLRNELETLEAKKAELALKISKVRKGVTDFTTGIDAMRVTRDKALADIDVFDRQTMELNKRFSTLGVEKNALNIQVQSAEATPLSDAYRTILQSVELKKINMQKVKKELEKIESETERRLREIDSSNVELKNLKDQLAKMEKDIPLLQKHPDNKVSPQKKITQGILQKSKIEKESLVKFSAKSAVSSQNPADIAQPSWFDFNSSDAIKSVVGEGTNSVVSWDTAFSGATNKTHASWDSTGTTTTGDFQNRQKYRAMYDFPAGREDELTLVAGTEIWVLTDFTPIPGMEDWYKGEHEGRVGWFPKAYVERLDEPSTDLFGSAFETLVQSSSIQKSEIPQQDFFNSQISQPSAISSRPTAATNSVHISAPNNIPPEKLLVKAIYPWKARQETDLTFDKDDIILVKEQEETKWYGELNGKSGWFPKAYVQLIEATSKSWPAVNSATTDQAVIAGTSTTPPDTHGEYYVALYTYTSDEPADLNFQEGDTIFVTSVTGDWWSGTILDQNRSGIFPANYVKKMEIQPTKSGVSSPKASSSYDSLLGDFNSVFTPTTIQTSSMKLIAHPKTNVEKFDEIDAIGINLDASGFFSVAESFTAIGNIPASSVTYNSNETNPAQTTSTFKSFDLFGSPESEADIKMEGSNILGQPGKDMFAHFDQIMSSKSESTLANDVNNLSWSISNQGSFADAHVNKKADETLDFLDQDSKGNTKNQLFITESQFVDMDPFGNVPASPSRKGDPFTREESILSEDLISGDKSAIFGSPGGGVNDFNLDWGFEDSEKAPASQTAPTNPSLLDSFDLSGSSNTVKIVGGNTADQGHKFDILDDFGFGEPFDSSVNSKNTMKSSMSLPDILALENDAIQSDLLDVQSTASIMKGHKIPKSASHTSSIVQVNFDTKKPKIGTKPAPVPPVVKSFFGKAKKKKPEQKVVKKPEIARVMAPYVGTGSGQLSLEVGNLINVKQKSPRGWWEGEIQVRGQKKKTGWFPSNHVTLLGTSSARSTPEPTAGAALSLSPQSFQSAAPQNVINQDEIISFNEPETVVALYTYVAQNADELTFQKDAVITVLNRDNPDWWSGQVNGQTGVFPSNYVTTNPESQSCK